MPLVDQVLTNTKKQFIAGIFLIHLKGFFVTIRPLSSSLTKRGYRLVFELQTVLTTLRETLNDYILSSF